MNYHQYYDTILRAQNQTKVLILRESLMAYIPMPKGRGLTPHLIKNDINAEQLSSVYPIAGFRQLAVF